MNVNETNETKRANKASWYGEWQTGTLKESARGQDQETATPSTTQQDFAGFDDAVAVCRASSGFWEVTAVRSASPAFATLDWVEGSGDGSRVAGT